MPSSSTKVDESASRRSGSITGTISAAVSRGRARARIAAPWIAGAVVLLLLSTTLLIGWMVRESMREMTRESLESVLASNVSALDLWLSQRRADVERIAGQDELLTEARTLLESAKPVQDADFAAQIPETLLGEVYLGWSLSDVDGRIIASSETPLVGKAFEFPQGFQDRLDRGRSFICRPIRSPVAVGDETSGPQGGAVMFAVLPVTKGLQSLGSFSLMMDPLGRFSQILKSSRIGETGETFAFDSDGTLLSPSRFEDTLRNNGILKGGQRSPLNVALRDPSAKQGLTLMADQATRGATGTNVSGYNSYLGTPVIGCWSWVPQYGFGVATEMHYAEAYETMRILRNAFIGALLVVVLAGFGVFSLLRLVRSNAEGRSSRKELKRRMGQYDLGKRIGRGGMGSVYHGRHHLLRRDVAIKVLEHTDATARSLSRFEREVQMTAKLRHPNTIEIYDYGRTDEGTFFYVMEYVEGISLQQLVDHYGRQPPERVIYLLVQVCGSIAEAHKHSMVHRDIKPANILLTARSGLYDLVKVLDFGLVKEIDRDTVELTRTESMTGTPLYMSPETVRDASKANRLSDIYSIGAVGYTLLTGLPPFDGPSSADICAKQLNDDPIRPDQRIGQAIADDLQNILMSCLRKDPDDRPVSAEDLADALLQCQDAGLWSVGDACQWWEAVFDGPRDDLDDLRDNSRPSRHGGLPTKSPREQKPGHDTKVDDLGGPDPIDKPSEKTAL